MDESGRERAQWMRPGDGRILERFDEERAQYPALVGTVLGMHLPYVERRCEELAARGLLETVSGEVVYRVTADGRRYLAGELDPVTLSRCDD